ncbi:MAG: T9SS type A sorting domain-containing protein [Bacteroidota bacterium]
MKYIYFLSLVSCLSLSAQEIPSFTPELSFTDVEALSSNYSLAPCAQVTEGTFETSYGTNFTDFVMADNFNVGPGESASINTLIVNILTPQGNNIASADIKIHADVSGFPGAVLEFFDDLAPTDQTVVQTGTSGNDFHQVTFDLSGSELELSGGSAGAKYWIAITTTATSGVDNQFWEATSDITNGQAVFSADGGALWTLLTVEGVDYEFVMTVEAECILSVDDFDDSQLAVFPNPTDGILQLDGIELSGVEVELIDLNGRLLDRLSIQENRIDLHSIPAGLYFLRIEHQNTLITKKIIKR